MSRAPIEPPPRIARRVKSGESFVTFPSAKRPWVLVFLGIVVGTVLSFGLGISSFVLAILFALVGIDAGGLMVLGSFPTLLLMVAGGFFGWVASRQPRPITITAQGGRYGGLLPPNPEHIGDLRVTGKAGRPMEITTGNTRLGSFVASPSQRGWSFDAVTWLADRIADITGADWVDERPEQDWRRWETDPVYRRLMAFEHGLEQNQKRFAAHHGEPPVRPPGSEDLHGLQIRLRTGLFSSKAIELDAAHLKFDGRTYRLDTIHMAAVEYRRVKTKNSTRYYGKLQFVTGDRVKSVVSMSVNRAGGTNAAYLNWLAARINEAARVAEAPRDRGTARDIPDALGGIVAGQRIPEP